MTKKSQTKTQKTFNILITILLTISVASALPFQSHPGDQITDEITTATLSCSNIQQSDVTDDIDFCVDVDTRCNIPGLCTQLCLGAVCLSSFSELETQDKLCNQTGVCDQLCIGNTCITSFGGGGGGSSVVGSCSQGFIKEIDSDGNVTCQRIISADIFAGTITSTNILDGTITTDDISDGTITTDDIYDGTITPADLDSNAGYCAGGTCAGSLAIFSTSDHATLSISSIGMYSAVDFYEKLTRKWGIGKNPSDDFYIDDSSGTVLTIKDGGNVGIGTTSPDYKLEVEGGLIKATGGLIIETRTVVQGDPTTDLYTGRIWIIE